MNGNKSKLKALVSEGRASVIAMQNAYRELAVEFLDKKRAANWKVINDAWVGASKFLADSAGGAHSINAGR